MNEYDVRKGQFKNLEGAQLPSLMKEVFGNATPDGNKFSSTFGALQPLTVWLNPEKKTLGVETSMKKDVDGKTASDTITRYNQFLEKATGYSAKERSKKAQQKAKKGAV